MSDSRGSGGQWDLQGRIKEMHRLMLHSTLYRTGRHNPHAAEFEKLAGVY